MQIRFEKKDILIYVLLLSAPVLLTLYRYYGYPKYFFKYFPKFHDLYNADLIARYWQFSVFFVLMFILPVLYVKWGMKKSLYDFGWGFGDIKYGLKWLIAIPLLIAPVLFFAAQMPSIKVEYPLAKSLLFNQTHLFVYELAYVLLYYVAWEFFFRGFLLFGLRDRFGDINAILIQTISSTLVHIGKPESEILGAIVVGILFGYIALKSKSIWYVFLLHVSIGVLTDIFIIYNL